MDSLDQEIQALQSIFWSDRDPEGLAFAPLADAFRRKGALREALDLLTDGSSRHPDYATGHVMAMKLYVEQGMDAEAEFAARRVLDLDPGNVLALSALVGLLHARGEDGEAADVRATLLEADPGSDEARAAAALPLAAAAPDPGFAQEADPVFDPTADDLVAGGAPVPDESVMNVGDLTPEDPVMEIDAFAPEEPAVDIGALAPGEPVTEVDAESPGAPVLDVGALAPDESVEDVATLVPEEPILEIGALAPDEPIREVAVPAPEEEVLGIGALAPDEPVVDVGALAPEEPVLDVDVLAPEQPVVMDIGDLAPEEPALEIDALAPDEPVVDVDVLAPDPPDDAVHLDDLDPPDEAPIEPDALPPEGDEDDGYVDRGEPVYTRTLAELYVRQGFTDQALEVYRHLLSREPEAADLRRRIAELESGGTAPGTFAPAASDRDAALEGGAPPPAEAHEDVETLARDLAESGHEGHEVDTPFAWADEGAPAPDAVRVDEGVARYFEGLLAWGSREDR